MNSGRPKLIYHLFVRLKVGNLESVQLIKIRHGGMVTL